MQGNAVSLEKTEELGKLTEEEWLRAPGPGEYQPLSSSSDENDRADDAAEGMEHDSELPTEGSAFGTIIQISVSSQNQIYVPAAFLGSFLQKIRVKRISLPIP